MRVVSTRPTLLSLIAGFSIVLPDSVLAICSELIDLRMEAKESSAAPGAAALPETKDGPVNDEGHPLDAESLAKEAAFLFQSSRLQDCLHVLNQLLQKKQDDPKVRGNFFWVI